MHIGKFFLTCAVILFASIAWASAKTAANTLHYFKDVEFKDLKSSGATFGVFFCHEDGARDMVERNAIKSLNSSVSDMEEYDIKFGLLDCSVSNVDACQKPEGLKHVVFYKNGDLVRAVSSKDIQIPWQAVAYMKHYLVLNLLELNNKEDYNEVQRVFVGQADVLVFYISTLGTEEHLRVIDRSIDLPQDVVVCLTPDKELNHNGDIAWYLSCSSTTEGETCATRFSTSDLSEASFQDMISRPSPVTVFTTGIFIEAVNSAVNTGSDVLILIAGVGKFKEALMIANNFVAKQGETVRCIVVNSLHLADNDDYLSPRIQDGKIFMAASPGKLGNAALLDVGFMEEESVEEAVQAFHHALSSPYAQEKRLEPVQHEKSATKEQDEDVHSSSPVEIQDDPVVFSVHKTEDVKDLYYLDYKTIPRLTDKTYDEVTESDEFAVLLFTLEFNSRSLATLVTYVEIHKEFKDDGESPLYRVECYNWPDVCQRAGVTTYPRMFFYPAASQERIEYNGLWDKKSMEDAIKRYRMPSVVVVRQKEDILQYLPLNMHIIVGFFETDEGTDMFKAAAEEMNKDYPFIEVHGQVAQFMANQYKVHFEHRGLHAFDFGFPHGEQSRFETKEDIFGFIEEAFAPSPFEEITIYNFAKVVNDPKPLVIYFRVGADATSALMLNQSIQILSPDERYAGRVMFTWMDAMAGSTGEFVLNTYNDKSGLQNPLVAFFDKKESVMLRSCHSQDCDEMALAKWLDDCIEGKVEATYSLSEEQWKPRLAGYDFLEKMRDDGSYPEEESNSLGKEDDESPATSHKKGRTVASLREKPKHDEMHEVKQEEPQQTKSGDGKKQGHTEL